MPYLDAAPARRYPVPPPPTTRRKYLVVGRIGAAQVYWTGSRWLSNQASAKRYDTQAKAVRETIKPDVWRYFTMVLPV